MILMETDTSKTIMGQLLEGINGISVGYVTKLSRPYCY